MFSRPREPHKEQLFTHRLCSPIRGQGAGRTRFYHLYSWQIWFVMHSSERAFCASVSRYVYA